MHWGAMRTVDGYLNGEAGSAMHKAIRRGEEEEALFWASQLDRSGNGNYVFKWLRIIASEDVGPADNSMVLLTRTLYENWLEQRTKGSPKGDTAYTAIPLVHAVIALCRAAKCRAVDNALMLFYEEPGMGDPSTHPVPDYAKEGAPTSGSGLQRFFVEAAHLHPELEGADPYRARAIKRKQRKELPRKTNNENGSGPKPTPQQKALELANERLRKQG